MDCVIPAGGGLRIVVALRTNFSGTDQFRSSEIRFCNQSFVAAFRVNSNSQIWVAEPQIKTPLADNGLCCYARNKDGNWYWPRVER